MNPWQERNQVVTSISWVSRIEDAKDSLLRSRWDLIIAGRIVYAISLEVVINGF
jgi:hypothetical protein